MAKIKEGEFLREPYEKIIYKDGRVGYSYVGGFHVFRAYYVTKTIERIEKLKNENKISQRADTLLLCSKLVGHKKYDTTYKYYRLAERNKIDEALYLELNKNQFFKTPFTDKQQTTDKPHAQESLYLRF